jgi:dipeptidyl aminopeptidase/acylaminoacyl peptidase
MANHDYIISNQTFPSFRTDLNNSLSAIASNNSSASEPATTYAYQWWYDTNNDQLKIRNRDNDAWITVASFNQTTDTITLVGTYLQYLPTITSISPDTIDNNASNVVITGTNFVITPNVEIIASTGAITYPNSITRDSATQLTINVTLPTDGTYFIRVENPDGLAVRSSTALLTVSDVPTWTTPAGSLGSIASGSAVSLSVAGTSDSTVAYSETTAVLTSDTDTPNSTMNLSLNSSTGAITGTAPEPTAEKVYNFTLRLTDAESQTTDRAFSITVTTGINNGGQFN